MYFKKSKLSKSVLACVAVCLLLVFFFGMISMNVGLTENIDTYTIFSDEEYYSETTYYLNELVYNEHLQKRNSIAKPQAKIAQTSLMSEELDEQTDDEFVVATIKKVWVSETVDENGEVADNHLLTKSEIEQLEASSLINADSNIITASATVVPPIANQNVYIGGDSTSMYHLDINMTVYRNSSTNKYKVSGYAYWDAILVWAWQTNEAAEEYYHDYMGITWGGEGLYGSDFSISGEYHNNKAVSFSRKTSDSYAGYVWQFKEKSGWLGKEMKEARANVTLEKQGTKQGKYTCAKLTYIHTYGKTNSSLSISADTNPSLAASVAFSTSDKSWQVEISVGNIEY